MKEKEPGSASTAASSALAHEAQILSNEVAAILESPALRRAPILSRLLRYLLDRTLAGEGDRLKAYTVAVDGLARAADFDSQLDSYPRVQVVRLRKALENYYSENASHIGACVYLGTGSYRLRLEEKAIAYPGLAGSADRTHPPALAAQAAALRRGSIWRVPAYRLWAGLAISIAIVGLVGLAISASREAATAQRVSKALSSAPMRAPIAVLSLDDEAASPHERAVVTIMSDGLRRSWVARIRDEGSGSAEISSPPAYRIVLREAAAGPVSIELIDTRSGTLLWTGSEGPPGTTDLRERLAPTIAMISGPFGVIARTETGRLRDNSTGSYACVLRYFAFLKARDRERQMQVKSCLNQPVDDPQLDATVAALRSFFTLESHVWRDRAAQIAAAEQLARVAGQANADDAYAQYAMARLAYVQGRCAAAQSHSERAVTANPYDSMVVTALAGLASQCADAKGAALLDRAYRIRNDNDVAMRAFIVLATLSQGQTARLTELGHLLQPPAGPQLGSYLLTETLIAAAQGRNAEAAKRWSEFRRLYPGAGPSDDDRLKMIILSDPLRHRVLGMLRDKGVIGT